MFDSLINRKRKPIRYPAAKRFLWFHPHFHKYSEHITLNENFTFTKRTDGGDFVIRACKLNLVESLEKRFLARAVTNVVHADGLEHAVDTIAANIRGKIYGIEQGAKALIRRFNLNMVEAETVLQTKLTDSVDADIKVREDLRRMFRVVNARPPLKS
ncbi:hypothetical protein DT070_02000 [Polaromonas sp. SP1]|nr:hypothetical protein DT070_02000 [Polaromonas sp. SP1]